VAGVGLRDGRQRWGSVHSGDEGPLGFRRAACAHTGAVHGAVDPVLPQRSRRALAMDRPPK